MRRTLWGSAAAVTIAAALLALGRGDGGSGCAGGEPAQPLQQDVGVATRVPPHGMRDAGASATTNTGTATGAAYDRATLPASLQGTDVPGGFRVGADGHLIPTRDALDVFDYFLAASGEEPAEALHARIRAHIRDHLGGEAAAEAEALLEQVLDFREALRVLAESEAPPHDLERRLQWIRELRRSHFGAATADALFGEEERALAIDLERRRVHGDPSLDEAEREAQLAALEAELPPQVSAARARARAPMRVHQRTEAMREAGASDDEIFEARAAEFGPEAAERLAALDAERAAWQSRVERYMHERDELLAELAAASDDERSESLAALRSSLFDEQEQRRVRALEGAGQPAR